MAATSALTDGPGAREQQVGDPPQPADVVDVAAQEWDPVDGGRCDLRHQGSRRLFLPVRRRRIAPEVLDELVQGVLGSVILESHQRGKLVVVGEARLDPVHHQSGHRHLRLGQLAGEVDGLLDGVGAG
jgi:hypothetical protein